MFASVARLAMLLLPALLCASTAIAAEFRFQTSLGRDSNPLEALDRPADADQLFFRVQGEAEAATARIKWAERLGFTSRGFVERYAELPSEQRAQGEFRGFSDFRAGNRGGIARLELGWRGRDYPDSTTRNFQRWGGTLRGRFRLGPKGVIQPRVEFWTLDYARTAQRDQAGRAVEVAYELGLGSRFTASAGLEIGGLSLDRPSLQVEVLPDSSVTITTGPDQSDNHRLARVGGRYLHGVLAQAEYGLRSYRSNSIGSSFRRHEFRWLISKSLPGRITGLFYGNIESTQYTDNNLDDVFVIRLGEEEEAGDDNNVIVLQLTRRIASHMDLGVRHTWLENESLLVGTYYRKRVWSTSISWESNGFVGN